MKHDTHTDKTHPNGSEHHPRHHGRGGHSHHRHHGKPPHGKRRRLFDYGELRLLVLALIADKPRHGYELIKDIETRFEGTYTPSPGVIYPTLSWLEDMGYTTASLAESGRKRASITAEGAAFLTANRQAADQLLTRRPMQRPERPPEVAHAMEALKSALRDALPEADPAHIAEVILAAATQIREQA